MNRKFSSCLNEDGTLRQHQRVLIGSDGKITDQEETIGSKFLKVTARVKNYSDHVVDAPLYIDWAILEKREDGRYSLKGKGDYIPVPEENWIIGEFPVYFSDPQYTTGEKRLKSFYWRDLQPGETLEYTMIYVFDEDIAGKVYLMSPMDDGNQGFLSDYVSLEK